jgi:L-ascorbate metabolism protein UlaG (beta-lactamase superfamily)
MDREPKGLKLFWLGQAGFLVVAGDLRIVIDPYLSDSLSQKYAGQKFPHQRMMQSPIDVDELVSRF